MKRSNSSAKGKIRYAVVGLGDIAQGAVLPAFANAKKNSVLTALISDDATKLKQVAKLYKVEHICDYKDYEAFLHSGAVDAVYLCLPNSMHCEFTIRAAQAGVHVLTEKPLAKIEDECQQMIEACAKGGVHLMAAYRLHFERANLEAIHLLHSGKIGELRFFQSIFSQQVKPGNIRLDQKLSGGTLYDVGVYCINAARYLFRDEPTEVFAFTAKNKDPRFREIDEMTSATLRFPKDRLATFTTSFGAASEATYTVVGTRGVLTMRHGFEYSRPIEMELKVGDRIQKRKFALRDQFAPELIYFSDCILKHRPPEPDGVEGLLDVHIVRSLYESAEKGRPIRIKQLKNNRRPDLRQEIFRPTPKRPKKIHASSPSR